MNELLMVLDGVLQLIAGVAECWFLCRLNGKQMRAKQLIPYFCIWLTLTVFFNVLPTWTLNGWMLNQAVTLALLCLYSRFLLQLPWPTGAASASILLVLNALFSQLGALLTYLAGGRFTSLLGVALLIVVHAGRFFVFVFLVRKLGRLFASIANRYLYLLLVPCALFLLLFADSFYTLLDAMNAMQSTTLATKSGFMLATASASFALVLYTFAKASQYASLQRERDALALAVQGQKQYVEEATRRDEANRTIQHDLKNHLLILAGLLEKPDTAAARQYLKKLDAAATSIGQVISTGCPAVDVVMREKLLDAVHRGIAVSYSVHLPDCEIDEFDLCVIFANTLDNAIHACSLLSKEQAWIRLHAGRRQQFWVLEFSNSTGPQTNATKEGTGLRNIRQVAEKYGGTVDVSHTDHSFHLAVLLCLPEAPSVADL